MFLDVLEVMLGPADEDNGVPMLSVVDTEGVVLVNFSEVENESAVDMEVFEAASEN